MCDTFIALTEVTKEQSVIFAKNSDREANEAQAVEFYPEKKYPKGDRLKCTYIEIPQVEKTYGIIISRPFWMWGAEMGVNDQGVVIGNEAVFTKFKVEKEGVLTGMDLLRLALERVNTARKAKDLIIDLIEEYGQGGIGGYEDKNFAYHNSFIIADYNESWVLETAGKFWVTKKVKDFYAISNGLTIESDYDEIHPEALSFAQDKGWVKGEFKFSSVFSDLLFTTFSACKNRRSRAEEILRANRAKIDLRNTIEHLRDHQNEHFKPSQPLLGNTICAHAGNSITRNASQTTGSMIVQLKGNSVQIWVTATSAPCISVFKPVTFSEEFFSQMLIPGKSFDQESLWWKHEILHREILKDYRKRRQVIQKELEVFQEEIIAVFYSGDGIKPIAAELFKQNLLLLDTWIKKVKDIPVKEKPNFFYRNYWKKLNKKVKIPVD